MNAVFNWFLIYKARFGIAGSHWATNFTRAAECLLIGVYIMMKRYTLLDRTWTIISWQHLSSEEVKPFMNIGVSFLISEYDFVHEDCAVSMSAFLEA